MRNAMPDGYPAVWLLLAPAALLIGIGWALHATGLDAAWLLHVHAVPPSHASAVAWSCVTVLGMAWPAMIILLALDRGGSGTLAALLLPTLIAGTLLTHVPKLLLAAPRPAGSGLRPTLHVIGQAFTGAVSMPSGHALTAAATAALLWAAWPQAQRRVVAGAIVAAAALVAWSRVVVGAHWPSDVFVGAGLGLLAAAIGQAICARTTSLQRGLRTRTGQLWLAAIELGLALGFTGDRTGYPDARPIVVAFALAAVLSATFRMYDAWLPRDADRKTARSGSEIAP